MKKQSVIVRDDQTKTRAISIINNLILEPPHEVLIRPYKFKLSDQQRNLYFLWCGIIGESLGNTKEEQHIYLKKEFLIPIYEREHEGFAEMMDSLRRVYLQAKEEGLFLLDEVVKLTSIRDANVAEGREYLTNIDRFAAELGIRLPVPDDFDRRAWKR